MAGVGPRKAEGLGWTGLWLSCHRSPDISASPVPPGGAFCSVGRGKHRGPSWSGGPTQESAEALQRLTQGWRKRLISQVESGGLGQAGCPGVPTVPPGQVHRRVSFSVSPRAPWRHLQGGNTTSVDYFTGRALGPPVWETPRSLGKKRLTGGDRVEGLPDVLSLLFSPTSSRP